jgi:hypothetical protein
MSLSSVAADPELIGGEELPAGVDVALPARKWLSWVRPAAVAVLVVAVVVAAVGLIRYLQVYGSLEVAPDAPQIAAALLVGVVGFMALAVLVLQPELGELRQLVALSAAWSAALLVALLLAWSAIARADEADRWHGAPVFDAEQVDAYLAKVVPDGVEPILIPTGVLIKSMEFLNVDNVQVTGFIWQRFGPDVPEDLDRGVVLAEAVKEAYDAKEVYRYEENGIETIGWYFAATLRQPFEYAEYPFDEQDVWLRLWARDFTANTVLVPDFDSYLSMNPPELPGLEREFVYSGWAPVYSGFSLSNQPYGTSYGIGTATEFAGLPELYFNLILARNFAGPFFEHLVFSLAVAFMLFGLITLTTDDENLKSRFQLSTAGVLASASGLLFAVILKHNQLRTAVGSTGVSYIEMIPILLYTIIIVVVLNAILLASPLNVKLVRHRNNLLPVLAYWPMVLGILLVVTLYVFFRP